MDPVTVSPPADDGQPAQYGKVLGYPGLAGTQCVHQFADTEFSALLEQYDDAKTRWVRQCRE